MLVTGLDKGLLRLIFLSAPRAIETYAKEQFDFMPMEEPRIGRAGHPASAKERSRRLDASVKSFDLSSDAIEDAATSALLSDPERWASAPASDKPGPLRIPIDNMELVLTLHSEDERFQLNVQLVPAGKAGSAAGIRVRIRGPRGRETEATTGDDGRATLPFGPGDSELVIEIDPPLALALEFPD